jgi:hypothetical protein
VRVVKFFVLLVSGLLNLVELVIFGKDHFILIIKALI